MTSTCRCCSASTRTCSPRPRPAWPSVWPRASSASAPPTSRPSPRSSRGEGGLRLRGIHVHMGSYLRDVAAWAEAGRRAVDLLDRVREVYAGPGDARRRRLRRRLPGVRRRARSRGLRRRPGRDARPRPGSACLRYRAIEPGRVVVGAAGWLVAGGPPHPPAWRPAPGGPRRRHDRADPARPLRRAATRCRAARPRRRRRPTRCVVQGAVCESTDTFGVHPLRRL